MGLRKGRKKESSWLIPFLGWTIAGAPLLILCGLVGGAAGGVLGAYFGFSAGLPNIPDLRAYRPKTVSTVYAEDGTVTGIFYKEKRFPISVGDTPPHVINAFLAAEDTRFFSHPGVDWFGVIRAAAKNFEAGTLVQGASTITQQVTRNFLLPTEKREKKFYRKVREALLSFRLEKTLSKLEILGLYLNEIYLGSGAYGVESGARIYFGKGCRELTIAEAALLAGVVSSPSKYSPRRNLQAALEKRAFVLSSMLKNNFITQEEYNHALKEAANLREELPNPYEIAPYFTEAVRRYIVEKYGEDRLYNEGLRVWTTCDLALQKKAQEAVINGALDWEKRQNRPRGLVRRLTPKEAKEFLESPPRKNVEVGQLIPALVIENQSPKKPKKKQDPSDVQACTLALEGRLLFNTSFKSEVRYQPNDLLLFKVTEVSGENLTLDHYTLPPIQGALVCIENATGYVRALAGGIDFQQSSFNRAVQAKRQPGSAFKPFVYTAAMEWGYYTPSSIVVDEPIAVVVGPGQEEWIPMNSDNQYAGPLTLRQALAHSRNTAAVKMVMDVGVDSAIRMAYNMGIRSYLGNNLSISLGSSEVTLLELTSAYSVFPNMGIRVEPVLVKKVVDRFGHVLEDNTSQPVRITPESVANPSASAWIRQRASVQPPQNGPQFHSWYGDQFRPLAPEPFVTEEAIIQPQEKKATRGVIDRLLTMQFSAIPITAARPPEPRRVISPQSARLMVSVLRDTCVFGTAAAASKLRRPDLAGKTGTTDDCSDAWFIGFNPKYTTGVWVGYDAKVSLGKKEYGHRAALPVWMAFMKQALEGEPPVEYPIPPGLVMYRGNEMWNEQGPSAPADHGPDLDPRLHSKRVNPIDMSFAGPESHMEGNFGVFRYPGLPYGGFVSPYPGFGYSAAGAYGELPDQFAGDQSGAYYPSSVRVLTPTGETLGHAPVGVNREGKAFLHKEHLTPSYAGQADADDEQPDVTQPGQVPQQLFPPRAARSFRNPPDFFHPDIWRE